VHKIVEFPTYKRVCEVLASRNLARADKFSPKVSFCFRCSGSGGETDVSLDCGRFYGPFVRLRMRMSEEVNE
jgi:hypothetical protein